MNHYRCWDAAKERMINWDCLIGYWDIDHLFNYDIDSGNNSTWVHIPMQNTYIKDCLGNEIFDGDILEASVKQVGKECLNYHNSFMNGNGKYYTGRKIKVRWTVERVSHMTYSGFSCYGKDRRFQVRLSKSVVANNNLKVIGNIYENKGLL